MLLMARAGYHPDFVFALHHLLLMNMGEQSKFGAFFSDHPRWETRDQRSDKVYSDALAEFNRLWPDSASSPGGRPPTVAFLGQPVASANKQLHTADVVLPAYCRNSDEPIDLLVVFRKNRRPVPAANPEFADKDGNLAFRDKADCLEKNETTSIRLSIPASAVTSQDRSIKGKVYVGNQGELLAASNEFDVHFPNASKGPSNSPSRVVEIAQTNTSNMRSSDGPGPVKTAQGTSAAEPLRTDPGKAIAPPAKTDGEGTLTITSTAAGAEIFVDSTGQGKTPATMRLKPGKHSVQVAMAGYQDWVQDVSVNVDETVSLTANLLPVGSSVHETSTARMGPSQTTSVEVSTLPNPGPAAPYPASKERYPGGIGIAGVAGAYGVIITEVTLGGPAQQAGLKIGDTIIGIDDKPIKTIQMMESAPSWQASGSRMTISYIRNGIAEETTLTVQKHNDSKLPSTAR
jgi:hypothetical protein